MTKNIKKLLIGASVIASFGAIASSPAFAGVLSLDANSIQFNTTNYRTYTGGSTGTFKPTDLAAARAALTDNNPTSNVELWYTTENPTANVGFSGKIAGNNVSVTSVTSADWAVFGNQWLNDLLASNAAIKGLWNTLPATSSDPLTPSKAVVTAALTTGGLPSSGDPNIGSFTFNTDTNTYSLDLIGHLDLKPRLLANQYSTGNPVWDQFLKLAAIQVPSIQASEIAKVTINGQVSYAYSFKATSTGITTPDGSESYTGKYTWTKTVSGAKVPEPSAMLGLLGVGGFFAIKRKLAKKA